MAYALKVKQTVAQNLVRVVTEQIESAISELSDRDLEPQVAIHQARKRIKKIRALIRLVQEELGTLYSYENLLFRDATRRLADIRDAQCAVETFQKLSQRFPSRFGPQAYKSARNGLEERRNDVLGNKAHVQRIMDEVVDTLSKARKRLKSWPIAANDYSALASGHRKVYRRGRRLFTQTQDDQSPEMLHELRKATKYHWYHGRLLKGIRSKRMAKYNVAVKRMADLLGEHQDMAVLRIMLLKHPERYGTYHEIRELLKLIDRRQEELWQQALPLGNLIFLDKPKYIERRMLEDWERWKNTPNKKTSNIKAKPTTTPEPAQGTISDKETEITENIDSDVTAKNLVSESGESQPSSS
jgi:CHAD domain-containing protein